MCQYDLGYNLYCTNRECHIVQFIIQEQFHEDDDRARDAFRVGGRQPCSCGNRWFRWHYHASRSGRDVPAARGLCGRCANAKRGFRGAKAEADKRWPEESENLPHLWSRHKKIESRFRGYMQEMDILSGDPIVEGRVIKTVDYSPEGGSNRSSPGTDIFRMSPEPENRYLEDVERVTERATVYEDKYGGPPSRTRSKRSVRFTPDTQATSKGSMGARRATKSRIDSRIPQTSYTPVWHVIENTKKSKMLPRLEHYTSFSRWFDDNIYEEPPMESEDESQVSTTSSAAPVRCRQSAASLFAGRGSPSESRTSTPITRRSRDDRSETTSATGVRSDFSTDTRVGGHSEEDESEVSGSAAGPSDESSVHVRRGGAGRYSSVRESEEFYD